MPSSKTSTTSRNGRATTSRGSARWRGATALIPDTKKGLPRYRAALVAGGFLSRHPLARGVTNLTGAGLTLADNIIGCFLDEAGQRWELDIVAHPPLLTDPFPHSFASAMSPEFDCYRAQDGTTLWFDCNLAHLDWLRAHRGPKGEVYAVASHSGIYRPVADVQNLVRDEFIFPFVGMHLLVPEGQLTRTWAEIEDVLSSLAAAVGIPLLLAERTPPEYYARRCLGALLPGPARRLEPWMLAYELGDAFHDYLDLSGHRVLEVGISGRIMAFAAALGGRRAACFGSAVVPCQVLLADGSGPADTPLRTSPVESPTPTGLAPLVVHHEQNAYCSLRESYRTVHRENTPLSARLPELLGREDDALRREGSEALAAFLDAHYALERPVGEAPHEGVVLATPVQDWLGTALRHR